MAGDMKRVGLVFDADGVNDFKQSLKNVNSALNENRAQFKLTKSTWDENTKASEKLRQTNEYLSKQYEDSAKKVKILSRELEEMESAENKDESAINKKKTALANATSTMNNYKKGLDETSAKLKAGTADIEEYAKKLDNAGKKAVSTGKTLTTHLSAPIMAVGASAMASWNKIDEAYDNIAAGTGATGDTLQELQDVFDEVFGSMPVEAESASTAIADLNTRFGFTGDALSRASSDFIKFSDVTKTDVATSVQLVSRAMGDAGIKSSEYKSVLDALTGASQASGISIETLTGNLAKYGAPMRALGYDTQESIAIFAQWEKAGVNTEIAFSGMKKAISNWSKAGKDSRVEFEKTLKDIKDCPDIASATTKAIEVFGTKAGPDLADAIQGGRFSIEEMMGVVEKSGGILEQTYSDMLDPADKAKVAWNNLTLAGAELGDVIQTSMGPIFDTLSTSIKGATEWFKSLDGSIKTAIVAIGAIIAAIGPLLVIFGTVASSISSVITLFTGFVNSTAVAGASTTLLGGTFTSLLAPILAIIGVVTAVIAAIVELWNTNEGFRTAVLEAIAGIQQVFQNLWDTVLLPILTIIKETLLDVYENGIKPLWDKWVEFVGDIILKMTELWEYTKPIVMWFIDTFGPQIVNVFKKVSLFIGDTIKTICRILGSWLDTASSIASSVVGAFKGIIDFLKNIFTGNWREAWSSIIAIFKDIFGGILKIAKVPINGVIGFVNKMIGAVETGINYVIGALNNLSFDVPDWIPMIGGDHWGVDIGKVSFGRIPQLAKGGNLLNGFSIIAEAGPELLQQKGNKTTVTPLTGNGQNKDTSSLIDYDKMASAFIKAMKYMSINLDSDKIGSFIDERLLKVV